MRAFRTARADEFVGLLRERLPDKTFRHCLSVAELMGRLADRLDLDYERAVTAGLLHDLRKGTKPVDLLRKAEKYEIELRPVHRERPALLHGPVAAEEARRKLDIRDEAVYEAVFWHTTGRPDWGRLGQLLYFCDFSEPLRSFPEAAEARIILEAEGFDRALCYVADERLEEVRKKAVLDPMTEAFHRWVHERNGCCR